MSKQRSLVAAVQLPHIRIRVLCLHRFSLMHMGMANRTRMRAVSCQCLYKHFNNHIYELKTKRQWPTGHWEVYYMQIW